MKVVCETCEAKYQIPDERVAGRRLKIRCRKCGGVMEARGDELVARGATSASSAEWFTSIDGTPIGPLSTDEIVSRISTGVLEWDAHVWREGYAEWKTIDAADTIVRAVASSRGAIDDGPSADSTERTSLPPQEDRDTYERDARTINEDAPTIAALEDSPTRISYDETPTRMYSGHSAPPGMLQPVARSSFASRPPGQLPPVARRVISESSPNLIASPPNPYASAPSIDVARAHLTGGAMPIPLSASRAPVSAPPVRTGYAGGEGSGLIDIRALASLAQTRMNAPQQPMRSIPPPAYDHGADDVEAQESDPLASFGTGHGVAFAALDSLAPVANREKPRDSTVPLAILTGAAMIAAAAFAALYITRAPAPGPSPMAAAQPSAPIAASELAAKPEVQAPAEPTPAPAEAVAPVAAAAEPSAAEAAPSTPEAEAKPEAPVETARATKGRAKRAGAIKARDAKGPAAADEAEEEEDEEPLAAKAEEKAPPPTVDDILLGNDDKPAKAEAEKPAPKAPPSDRSIDDLLDTAVAKKSGAPAPAPAAAPVGVDSPSRNDVVASMRKIESEVKACAANEEKPVSGIAYVAITVAGSSGKVMSAEVKGLTGEVGSCIARVARTATFAPFTKDKFSVTYPYRFK
jgi:predicted Zn finger-like uncharacterized protein